MNHPHLGIPFLKGVVVFCVIFTTFNLSWVDVIEWPMLASSSHIEQLLLSVVF
jgi:hypothetical protein